MAHMHLLQLLALTALRPVRTQFEHRPQEVHDSPSSSSVHESTSSSVHGISPCPENFQYIYEGDELKYGLIRVECPDANTIQINVEISVGNQVQDFNGDLILAESKSKTIEDVLRRRPISYRLYFPRWYNVPPKITKIVLNGELVCTGAPINFKLVRILTTINLQHTLKVNIPDGHPIHRVDPTTIPFHGIDFNPTPPKDPTKIYPFHDEDPVAPPTDQFFVPPRNGPIATTPSHEDPLVNFGVNSPSCGLSVQTNSLIARGQDVKKGQYPWLVAIFKVESLGPEFLCGANLISVKHVVTAGHCMKPNNRILHVEKIFLRLGEHNIHQWTQMSGSKTIGAERISVHPDYKPMSADADVALITLTDEVEFTKLIRPICMWTEPRQLDRIVGATGIVVGWGRDESNALITPEPKQIRFPVVSQEDCLRSHFTFREITSERTFCAGYRNGSGPCNGDSGGGFIMKRGNKWTLRGIVSMSIAKDRNCDFSEYFVFADVTKVTDWLFGLMRIKDF